MKKIALGRSNIQISGLGLGCWAIGGQALRDGKPCGWAGTNDEESVRAIHCALDMGVNFLDTADVYGCGHSEKIVARAIAGRRDKLIVATKFGFPINEEERTTSGTQCDPDYIRSACEESLRRLNTDYIDLYQFHLNDSDKGQEVREVLETLVETGKIRWYGWSTDYPDRAQIFAQGDHCTAIQQRLNVFEGNLDTLKVCENNNLASLNRSPLATGILTGKFNADSKIPKEDVRSWWNFKEGDQADMLKKVEAVRDVLTSEGRTLAQGALCWIWAKSPVAIPIPGFKTVKQVEENAGVLALGPLSSSHMAEIEEILLRKG
jgi:aryl-alcohol dehydrogenase-like predicted oxidoreductase